MHTFKRFVGYYKPYKSMFFMDMFCALILSVIDLVFPIIIRYLSNDVYTQRNHKMLQIVLLTGLFLFALYVLRYFCQYYITSWGHIMGAKMETDMRREIFSHLQKLSFSYYDNTNTGKLMSRITTDLFDISELAHHGPEDIFISTIKILGSLIILLFINIKITIPLFIVLGFIVYFSCYYNGKARIVFRKNREKIANVNAQIQDSLAGIRVVKSFSNEHIEKEKFEHGNIEFLRNKEEGYFIMGRFFSLTSFLQGLLYLIPLILGGYLIVSHELDTSDLITYILYIGIFLNPIERLINFTESFQRGMTGFDRFLEILDTEPEIKDSPNCIELKNPKGQITFNHVSFSYDDTNHILHDLNLTIYSGKTFALVGPSGGGKSTFCSLIPRFYELTEGNILIDDIDIHNISLKSLRNSIGIVQQDVYMFSGTIKENIAYGKQDSTDEDIITAAMLANAHEFIMSLENGYDTFVGERGVKLSGGQKQRISIARVFLKNPPILILDEATSSLDNESEKLIQDSLSILAKNRTTLVIAHRLSTIKNADKILVLTENGIEEQGTHSELLKSDGLYASLYNMQFTEI
jgi:ATP-binding cassette subfamily B protein